MQRTDTKSSPICEQQLTHAIHENVQCPDHVHFHMEIAVVTQGTLHMAVAGQKYAVSQGFGIFAAPFEVHAFHSRTPNRCRILEFPAATVPAFFEHLQQTLPQERLFPVSDECFTLLDKMLSPAAARPDTLHAQAVLLPLCCAICDHCRFAPARLRYEDVFLAAMEYINANYTQDLSLECVAAAVGVHPVTLSKKFTDTAQVGFHAYLTYLRIVHAARLLDDPTCTATEAAYRSGFGSLRSFNRCFLRQTGLTPGQYRRLPGQEKSSRLSLYI